MAKLYIFAIGGTGARVIKALTMLLACGVKSNFKEIVPIIIDPDKNGADINRTINILKEYQRIHDGCGDFEKNDFFKTKITTLSEIIASGFRYEVDGTQSSSFKDFIDFGNMDTPNRYFANLLFSNDNLNSNLEVGFKGNPNMGSVVLNQFTRSAAFSAFANNYKPDDSIFIISSIFGGTGAAGFPLLLKNIREGKVVIDENKDPKYHEFLKNAIVGAITVQPYFKLGVSSQSRIDSQSFITKTKAALHYYSSNVSGNDSLNAMYYIGDTDTPEYPNIEGGRQQKNDAHFVELASALAVIDFGNTNNFYSTVDGRATNQITFKEFGIDEGAKTVNFSHLNQATNELIRSNLTAYFYFSLFLKDKLKSELKRPYAEFYTNKFDISYLSQNPFYLTLSSFNKSFRIWLGEMYRNDEHFRPFSIRVLKDERTNDVIEAEVTDTSIFSVLNDVKERKSFLDRTPFPKKNYELFVHELNKSAEIVGNADINKRFMGVFSTATQSLVKKKLFSNE